MIDLELNVVNLMEQSFGFAGVMVDFAMKYLGRIVVVMVLAQVEGLVDHLESFQDSVLLWPGLFRCHMDLVDSVANEMQIWVVRMVGRTVVVNLLDQVHPHYFLDRPDWQASPMKAITAVLVFQSYLYLDLAQPRARKSR